MMTRLLGAFASFATASSAMAGTGLPVDGAALSGLAILGVSALAILNLAAAERRRERNQPGSLKLRVKARRYNQP